MKYLDPKNTLAYFCRTIKCNEKSFVTLTNRKDFAKTTKKVKKTEDTLLGGIRCARRKTINLNAPKFKCNKLVCLIVFSII